MKLPGVGEVDKKYVTLGGGAVGLIIIYGYLKKKHAASAAPTTTTDTTGTDPNAIDPTTGIPYSQEGGVYGYGAVDPTTGIPFQYESSNQQTTNQGYSNNQAWASDAINLAQSDLGATAALAQQSVADYLKNDPNGLPQAEFDLMSELIGLIGTPPNGSFRLHEASGTPSGGNGGGSAGGAQNIYPGQVIYGPWLIQAGQTPQSIASRFGISIGQLQDANPGIDLTKPGQVIRIPWLVKPDQSLQFIASRFMIPVDQLQQYLQG